MDTTKVENHQEPSQTSARRSVSGQERDLGRRVKDFFTALASRTFSDPSTPKRLSVEQLEFKPPRILVGNDQFALNLIPYVAINLDPDPGNGLAGAMEIMVKELGGPDGVQTLSHRYEFVGEDLRRINEIIENIRGEGIKMDVLKIPHSHFSEAFLGGPQIK